MESGECADRSWQQGSPSATAGTLVDFHDAPLTRFHAWIIIAALSGQASDGFEIGVIGLALKSATPALQLTPLTLGLLGGAALMGLFFGALLTGIFVDRFGRRPVFAINMVLISIFALMQFFVTSVTELFVLRFIIGFLLGTDYVVVKAVLMEFSPRRFRARIISLLAIAWAAGFVCAYLVGYLIPQSNPDAWRWVLLTGVVPALLSVPLRLRVPESPAWLVSQGRTAAAELVVRRHFGDNIAIPQALPLQDRRWKLRILFSRRWYRRTIVGATFFTCQVIPYFALGTFVSSVMAALKVRDEGHAGLVYNLFLLLGAVFGWIIVDKLPRRLFLVGSFLITATALATLALWSAPPELAVISAFAIVAFTLSAASSLCYVYLTELFPTALRGSGVGIAIATSRLGSAASTFLLPTIVAVLNIRWALGMCVITTLAGALVCYAWAPETRHSRFDEIEE